jgi:phosphoribosylcarboxyaminoimidazole (NCAIR) mutase
LANEHTYESSVDRSLHPAAKEVAMTTEVVSRITTIARRFEPMWRHAGGRNPTSAPAAESEHELVVLSRHRTSEGVVTYARSNSGDLQIWLTGAGRPAHTLIKSIRGPERPPA